MQTCQNCHDETKKLSTVLLGMRPLHICEKCLRQVISSKSWVLCKGCKKWTDKFRRNEDDSTSCLNCMDDSHIKCQSCGGVVLASTTILKTCRACVKNTNAEEGKFFFSDFNEIGGPKSTTKTIIDVRPFGVELESSTVGIRKPQTNFSSVYDGSIGGQEFVSPILHGDDGAEEIAKLCKLPINADQKCGFHIHLNAKDLNWWQVLQVARGYNLIQGILFDMMPTSRKNNETCTMIKTPYFLLNTKEQIIGTLYSAEQNVKEAIKNKRGSRHNRKRYEFLNTHAYFHHGTIEIRLHEGTFNYPDIIGWVNLNQALFKYFLATPIKETTNPFAVFNEAIRPYPKLFDYVKDRLARHKNAKTTRLIEHPEEWPNIDIENDLVHAEDNQKLTEKRVDKLLKVLEKFKEPNTPSFQNKTIAGELKTILGVDLNLSDAPLKVDKGIGKFVFVDEIPERMPIQAEPMTIGVDLELPTPTAPTAYDRRLAEWGVAYDPIIRRR